MNRPRPIPAPAALNARRAFTLVELLAALAISLLLIAAISASLDIYLRLTTAGQADVERQQVTRVLLDQMTRDVASVLFTPVDTTSAESSDASSGSSSSSTSSSSGSTSGSSGSAATGGDSYAIEVQSAESASMSTSVGLAGDAQSLVLHISRPQRSLSYGSPFEAASLDSRSSDLLSVSYFLATPGAPGLAGAVGDNAERNALSQAHGNAAARNATMGLARLEGDRLAIDHADLELDTAALAAAAKVLAPEIASLQFRYFDGLDWLDAWDSVSLNRLPLAIEVTLGFRAPPDKSDKLERVTGTVRIGYVVRHVIPVPLAEPYSATLAL